MLRMPSFNFAIHIWTVLARLCMVLLIIFPAFACSTLSGSQASQDSLTSAVEAFNTALRWGEYKLAAALVTADEQERFWSFSDLVEGRIRITNYEVRQVVWDSASGTIPVFVKFQYFFMHDPHLQTRTIRQQWRYSEQAKGWQAAESGVMDLVQEELPEN